MMDNCVTSAGRGDDACVCQNVASEMPAPVTATAATVSDRRREMLLLMHADFALFHGNATDTAGCEGAAE